MAEYEGIYVELPIDIDAEKLEEDAFTYLQDNIPDWEPAEPNLEVWMIRALARMISELRDLAVEVPLAIFRYFGKSLLKVLPIEASYASVNSTWTAQNNAGYTVPAGTIVGIPRAGDELVPFEVVNDVTIPSGSVSTAAGAVLLRARDPGIAASGLNGAPKLIDALAWVTSIVLTGVTTGGVDAETDEAYLNRLSEELELLTPRPIHARDFAIMAKRVAGVHRAVGLDGYNPDTNTYNNERYVTVAAVDINGNAVGSGVRSEVDTLLQAEREINFIVRVIDPTITAVDVTFTVRALSGYVLVDLDARAEQAIRDYLNPKNWGGEQWTNTTVVRYLEVAEVLNRVDGINYVESLSMRTGANAFASMDIALPGAVPLADDGVISGTVNAP